MKGLIIFGFGAVFGSLGTFLWLQKDYKKRLEQMENEVYSRLKEEKNASENGKTEGSEEGKSEENKADSEEKGESELRRVQENQRVLGTISSGLGYVNQSENDSLIRENAVQNVDYSSFSRGESEKNSVSLLKTKSDTCHKDGKIYEISYEDFEYEAPQNDKKCLKYYAENDTFVDFDGTISDTCHFLNSGWHENLKRCMPEKMWIRDDIHGCDYEISVVDDAYICDDFDGQEGV